MSKSESVPTGEASVHPTSRDPVGLSRGYSTAVLVITLLIQTAVVAAVLVPAVIAPSIAASLRLPVASIGSFIAIVYLSAVIAAVASGVIIRKWGAIRTS